MKKLSTPWWIYSILLLVAIILIVPYCIRSCSENLLLSVCCNIGYGITGSLVVAFLIDLSSTAIKNKRDAERLRVISSEYRTAFSDLRDCVLESAELRYGTDDAKRTFPEWIDYVLSPADVQKGETDEDIFDSIFEVQFRIEKIETAAAKLYELLLLNLDIEANSNDYRQSVKAVRSRAAHIGRLLDEGKYTQAAKSINTALIPKYMKDNSDIKELFEEPYCEDRYTGE